MLGFRLSGTLTAGTLALAMLAVAAPALAQHGPARVVAAPVETREIADTAPVIATLVPTLESQVASRAVGIVESLSVLVGDTVEAGGVLVRLDDQLARIEERNAEAALAAARAAVAAAEARAAQTRQALDRAAGLRGSTAFSRGAFEDLQQAAVEAESEIAQAQAEVGVAEAALARAAYDMEHMSVRAPFAGRVTERMIQPGEYVDLGQPLVRLLDTASLEIEADMPVDLVDGLSPGMVLEGRLDGGRAARRETFGAVVRSLLPVETTSTRTRAVRLVIEGDSLAERFAAVGRSVVLAVPVSAPREAPVLPKDALVQSAGGWSVFVADGGQAEPRTVRLGQSAGAYVEALSGVSVGEHVVVRGNERLRPGQPIAPFLADGTPVDTDPAPETGTETGETPSATAPDSGDGARGREDSRVAEGERTPIVPAGSAGAATRAN